MLYCISTRTPTIEYWLDQRLVPGVEVQLLPEKFTELRSLVEEIYSAKGMIPIQKVQRAAGQLSWAGGLFPWIRRKSLHSNSTIWEFGSRQPSFEFLSPLKCCFQRQVGFSNAGCSNNT